MDAPTLAEVNRRLFDTESLRLEAMDKAGIELSILSFTSPGILLPKWWEGRGAGEGQYGGLSAAAFGLRSR